jgi:amino acid transporter
VNLKNIFAKKDLEALLAEAAGEHRLHRVLGPWALTALGVGCIIGAGIFVVTGRAAALDAGPGVIVSYAVAGVGCALAALCYAEFAAMAPVAGSAYTYAYTTLGEIFAWIIGWDLILEYAMGCATVASAWTNYFNEMLKALHLSQVPESLSNPPWTADASPAGYINLPAVILVGLITYVLVLGIRESARTNATLVLIKLAVVVFVIVLGINYVKPSNWTGVPVSRRALPQDKKLIPDEVNKFAGVAATLKRANSEYPELVPQEVTQRVAELAHLTGENAAELIKMVKAEYHQRRRTAEIDELKSSGKLSAEQAQKELDALATSLQSALPSTPYEKKIVDNILAQVNRKAEDAAVESWGMLGTLGLNRYFLQIDDATRSQFLPYGFSGIMLGAAIVFFAFIGFDSISTHAEEARNPQRDVPFGILMSLFVCTVLYIAVAAVITGMVPYPEINIKAPIAAAFAQQPGADKSILMRGATALVSAGGLAGMTSVLLVLFLSQARVFMAMSRDGLLPEVFGTVHPKFQTPHIATIVTGAFIAVTAGFTPIKTLHEMVNIGTLLAFVMVCAAVFILRYQRPAATRPFRCPVIYIVAPLGIFVNLLMMLFLPFDSWMRLLVWLMIGLVIYFVYSIRHSHLAKHLMQEIAMPRKEVTGTKFDPEVVE